MNILTIEDDPAIRRGIVDALRFAGYTPLEAGNAALGLKLATEQTYDLLLLDLVLPGGDGLEILRAVRHVRPTQPVIILTVRGAEIDRVAGLRLGADDYVVKPFSVKESAGPGRGSAAAIAGTAARGGRDSLARRARRFGPLGSAIRRWRASRAFRERSRAVGVFGDEPGPDHLAR